jgi:hypothetical protein
MATEWLRSFRVFTAFRRVSSPTPPVFLLPAPDLVAHQAARPLQNEVAHRVFRRPQQNGRASVCSS